MKTKSRTNREAQPARGIPFLPHGGRIWAGKWGQGIAAHEGYLVTCGNLFPTPVVWSGSFEDAKGFLNGTVKRDELVDLTCRPRGAFWEGIGNNLLFPVNHDTGRIDASDEAFAAAHYVSAPNSPQALAFCILTRTGLASVTSDTRRAEMFHQQRMERLAR